MEMCHLHLNRFGPDGGGGNAGLMITSRVRYIRPFSFAAALAVIASFTGQLCAQPGYSIRGNEIVVDRSSHWEQWAVAGGTAEITGDGSVGPRFMRKEINAALNATEFENEAQGAAFDDGPGGVSAGSNDSEARFLIDGDPATTWGPDTDRPLSEWWAEVNLGRIVVANSVVVRFAEEGEGDPFLQFKVLAWRHAPPRGAPELWLNGAPDIPKYWELGRTDKPNKSQKVFEFVPDPEANNTFRPPESLIPASSNFAGDAIDRIQVIATDSDFDRASEVLPEGGDDRRGKVSGPPGPRAGCSRSLPARTIRSRDLDLPRRLRKHPGGAPGLDQVFQERAPASRRDRGLDLGRQPGAWNGGTGRQRQHRVSESRPGLEGHHRGRGRRQAFDGATP